MGNSRYLQAKQIAEILGCRTDSVRRMFREGRLRGAFKVPGKSGRILMSTSALQRMMKGKDGGRG
ncbi:MAG: helix-turn-helix domain-containing protein [Proteobacteria bacterium]|nr:helix-turn-helix domain-containing protein [Pseudomonadota bacterium]